MRIGIANDLRLAVEALRRAVALKPEHQVIWVAENGADAVALCARDKPDLVLMDLFMPAMNGVEATRRIMAATPCAILVVTASVDATAGDVFEAMGHGALDAIDTPVLSIDARLGAAAFLSKLDVIARLIGDESSAQRPPEDGRGRPQPASAERLVAIGASAGGPAALAIVLRALPQDLPAAIVIIQHVDAQFAAGMAEWLARQCALPVRLAKEGEAPSVGTALLAGTDDHLALLGSHRLGYRPEPREYLYRPSVDVFFRSVCRHWTGGVVGVLLTGMGRDGAAGLKALRDKGHHTIAQDEATSAVYGMPKAAAALNAAVDILPIERIAARLVTALAGDG